MQVISHFVCLLLLRKCWLLYVSWIYDTKSMLTEVKILNPSALAQIPVLPLTTCVILGPADLCACEKENSEGIVQGISGRNR